MKVKVLFIISPIIFISTSSDVFARRVKVSPSMTVEEVINILKEGRGIKWSQVPLTVQRELIEMAAEELQLEPLNLVTSDICEVYYEFLNGHTLRGLYNYYLKLLKKARLDFGSLPLEIQSRVEREDILEMNTMEFMYQVLFQRPRSSLSTLHYRDIETLIAFLQEGEEIDWRRAFLNAQRALVVRMADELGKRIEELDDQDYFREMEFLSGHSVRSFWEFYNQMLINAREDFSTLPSYLKEMIEEKELQKIGTAEFILKALQLDGSYETLEELITALSYPKNNIIWYRVPLGIQRQLLESAVKELGISLETLSREHFHRPLNFINGRTLASMWEFYASVLREVRKNFTVLSDYFETDLAPEEVKRITILKFIKRILNIPFSSQDVLGVRNVELYGSTEGIISLSREGKRIMWSKFPLWVHRNIIILAAEELGIEPSAFTFTDFTHRFQFLNGRTLLGLDQFYRDKFFSDYWKLPPRFREIIDSDTYQDIPTNLDFMRAILGLNPSQDPICRNFEDLIKLYNRTQGEIDWLKVPFYLQKELLQKTAQELGINVEEINDSVLQGEYLEFLGDTLKGFYGYYKNLLLQAVEDYDSLPPLAKLYLSREEVDKIEVMDLIKRIAEITPEVAVSLTSSGGGKVEGLPQELEWRKEFQYIHDEARWEEIVKNNPEQIAFYVKQLVLALVSAGIIRERSGEEFPSLWEILKNRDFREVPVPSLGSRSLVSLLNYFGDSYSILRFLEEKGLLGTIETEFRNALGSQVGR